MTPEGRLVGVRIAVVYDCLFPYTVGGGERWYRVLSEALAAEGASVTYLTRRQWDEPPEVPGVAVVAVSGRSSLYDERGVRRLSPTVRFGWGTFWWLVRHRRSFDAVQMASFPFWSILAVRLALVGRRVDVLVDWFELWSRDFWKSYAGPIVGPFGYAVQTLCLRLSPKVVVLSESNSQRLKRLGFRGDPIVLAGFLPAELAEATGEQSSEPATQAHPYVLFAGRHIRDKGVDLLPATFASVLAKAPSIRFVVAGDGPMNDWVKAECHRLGLDDEVQLAGFVTDEELERLLGGAACLLAPSRREGYGILVVDAMSKGTPVVTAAFGENLAVDHISEDNGRIADPPTPERLADAVVEVVAKGSALRASTIGWYRAHAGDKGITRSVEQMLAIYRG